MIEIGIDSGQGVAVGEGGADQGAAADQAAAASAGGSGSATAAVEGRPPTTLPWLRDPDWMYPSYIGVAAREAAAAQAAALAQSTAVATRPQAELAFASFPELPEEEAQEVIARLEAGGNGNARKGVGDGCDGKRRRMVPTGTEPGAVMRIAGAAATAAVAGLGLEVDDDEGEMDQGPLRAAQADATDARKRERSGGEGNEAGPKHLRRTSQGKAGDWPGVASDLERPRGVKRRGSQAPGHGHKRVRRERDGEEEQDAAGRRGSGAEG